MATQKINVKVRGTTSKRSSGGFSDENSPVESLRGKRRQPTAAPTPEEDMDLTEPEGDMMTMVEVFGADINKAFQAKRKRLETFAKATLKTSTQKVEQLWTAQHADRIKVTQDYSTQFNSVLQEWDADVAKSKEQEEKLQIMFQHQRKMFDQMKTSQSQRLKALKQLLQQYNQNLEAVEKTHVSEQADLQGKLRLEMALFQKKILMNTQQQGMASVRKSLESLLM